MVLTSRQRVRVKNRFVNKGESISSIAKSLVESENNSIRTIANAVEIINTILNKHFADKEKQRIKKLSAKDVEVEKPKERPLFSLSEKELFETNRPIDMEFQRKITSIIKTERYFKNLKGNEVPR